MLRSLNIKTNDILKIKQENNKIIITVPKKISLKEKLKEYKEKNLYKYNIKVF